MVSPLSSVGAEDRGDSEKPEGEKCRSVQVRGSVTAQAFRGLQGSAFLSPQPSSPAGPHQESSGSSAFVFDFYHRIHDLF